VVQCNLGHSYFEFVHLDELALDILVDSHNVGVLNVLEVREGHCVVDSHDFTKDCNVETDYSESTLNAAEVKNLDFPLEDIISREILNNLLEVSIVRDLS
jgi:hypothetical protein